MDSQNSSPIPQQQRLIPYQSHSTLVIVGLLFLLIGLISGLYLGNKYSTPTANKTVAPTIVLSEKELLTISYLNLKASIFRDYLNEDSKNEEAVLLIKEVHDINTINWINIRKFWDKELKKLSISDKLICNTVHEQVRDDCNTLNNTIEQLWQESEVLNTAATNMEFDSNTSKIKSDLLENYKQHLGNFAKIYSHIK